jgi:2-methylisocitrate lyase-like PEP mutase family enzyme
MTGPGMSVSELADLGVRRISIGGSLARVGWGAVLMAAEQIKAGSFAGLGVGASGKQLNDIFRSFTQS